MKNTIVTNTDANPTIYHDILMGVEDIVVQDKTQLKNRKIKQDLTKYIKKESLFYPVYH